jgi:hypothetical protein
MAASFNPPHPPSVFRYLKQAFRDYLAGQNAAAINITTIPTHAANTATVVAGTIEVDVASGVQMPTTVFVALLQGAVNRGTQNPLVTPGTGAYTASFPGGTCPAGSTFAQVTCTIPVYKSVNSPTFTLT